MANPNLLGTSIVRGKTFVTNLTTTGSILILSNSINSNKVFKIVQHKLPQIKLQTSMELIQVQRIYQTYYSNQMLSFA